MAITVLRTKGFCKSLIALPNFWEINYGLQNEKNKSNLQFKKLIFKPAP